MGAVRLRTEWRQVPPVLTCWERLGRNSLPRSIREGKIDYSSAANFDVLFSDKFSGFERFTRSRNYLVNDSGVFGVVETDDTLANTQMYAPVPIDRAGMADYQR
jgi:hypothetical protein